MILREVLDHAVLSAAEPVIVSGSKRLDHVVRWVHTADLYEIAPLLRGDEVLLTNGVGLVGVDEAARRIYVRRLAERSVAALVFEVGRTFAEVPAEMVAEAREVDLPIVVLQPALRFTEVAETLNAELIDRSVARLRYADDVSRQLSEALARGASLGELIEKVAEVVGTWAQLSDYAGRFVVGDVRPDEDALEAPVLVDGVAWGRLRIGPSETSPILCEAVLDRAPTVLGLCLIREQRSLAGTLRAQQLLLEHLVSGTLGDPSGLSDRLKAAGIPASDGEYTCVAIDPRRVPSAARLADHLIEGVGSGLFGLVDDTLCGILTRTRHSGPGDLAESVVRAIESQIATATSLCAVVGRTVTEVEGLPREMADVAYSLGLGQRIQVNRPVHTSRSLALDRLISRYGDLAMLRRFVEEQIGVIEQVDAAKGSQLVSTLEALIDSAGSKVRAAQKLHIRRQSLYYRLDQISKLLGTDLNNPRELGALTVALAARRMLANRVD